MIAESATFPQINEGNMCKSLIYKGKLIAAASAIHPQPSASLKDGLWTDKPPEAYIYGRVVL